VDEGSFRVLSGATSQGLLPEDALMEEAVSMIDAAQRITILYGEGCRQAAEPLLELAARIKSPMVYSLKAMDLIPYDHPLVAGGLGLLGTRGGVRAIESCDLLLVLGSDFPYRDWYPEKAPIIRVDIKARAIGRRTEREFGLIGDCRSVIEVLCRRLARRSSETHLKSVQEEKAAWELTLDRRANPGRSQDLIHPQAVAALTGELSASGAIITCDTGAVTVWAARHLQLKRQQRLLLSFNLATMAFAMPAALGVQLACPDRQVVALCGDGGFNMLMGDFLTAVKYLLPIKVIIFNNRRLGLIQMEQEAEGFPEHQTDLLNPDYSTLARSFGAEGRSISQPGELELAIRQTLASDGPALLDVRVATSEMTIPPRIEVPQAWGFTKAKIREWLFRGGESFD
jgi:pyruvate dehydrogenase (quinone)